MLELGCGAGGEIDFYNSALHFGWHGIDGSEEAVKQLCANHADVRASVVVGDFTKELPFGGEYDFIVDRAAVTHNALPDIRRCMRLVLDALKPGGVFVGCDWFSTKHSEANRGSELGNRTRTGYADGQFKDIGIVHFTDEAELIELFDGFEVFFLQERTTRRSGPSMLVPQPAQAHWISQAFWKVDYVSAVYDIVARKPK